VKAGLFSVLVSLVVVETMAVFSICPPTGAVLSTCTVSRNVAFAPEANAPIVAVNGKLPTGGLNVNVGPAICVAETNVVLAGMASLNLTLCAALGPALLTTIV